jgi:hypothetical protein
MKSSSPTSTARQKFVTKQVFVADRVLSIARGVPWTDEAEVGASTLPSFIRQVTERFSGREALVQRDADGAIDRWSYRDPWDRSVEVAKALKTKTDELRTLVARVLAAEAKGL